eukprot:Skav232765  [mRNA]  locus=scaffold1229:209585:214905:- [translate_table: standard]
MECRIFGTTTEESWDASSGERLVDRAALSARYSDKELKETIRVAEKGRPGPAGDSVAVVLLRRDEKVGNSEHVIEKAKQADWVRSICDKHGWKMKWMDVALSQARLHAVSVQIEHFGSTTAMELGLRRSPPVALLAPHWHPETLHHEYAHERRAGARVRTGAFLLACAAVRSLPRSRKVRRSRDFSQLRRGGLIEDVSQAVEEVVNTAEDALVHVARLPAWLSPERDQSTSATSSGKRRVVILGTGWAAHAIAKIIDINKVFTPMLAAAAVGTVEYRSILEHIRRTCESIDLEKKELLVRPYPEGLEEDFTVPYDVP